MHLNRMKFIIISLFNVANQPRLTTSHADLQGFESEFAKTTRMCTQTCCMAGERALKIVAFPLLRVLCARHVLKCTFPLQISF